MSAQRRPTLPTDRGVRRAVRQARRESHLCDFGFTLADMLDQWLPIALFSSICWGVLKLGIVVREARVVRRPASP